MKNEIAHIIIFADLKLKDENTLHDTKADKGW